MNPRVLTVAAVIVFHAVGLWALQAGLLHRAVALVIPVQVIAELVELPQPQTPPAPTPPQPPRLNKPERKPVVQAQPTSPKIPLTVALAEPAPRANAPTAISEPPPPASAPSALPPSLVAAPPAPVAPAKIELPSKDARYLNNQPPRYPPLSKRLGEQGRVVVRTFIDSQGTASQASIQTSSGYERLDQTALETVLKWRYTPGSRGGVPEAMWFNIPLQFVLD